MLKKITLKEIIDPIEIRRVIDQKKIRFKNAENLVKLIDFDSIVSLDFAKSFINYELNTKEYGPAGFFVNYNNYFSKGNFVKFGCYCNFFRYGTCNKRIDFSFFIEQNVLVVQWKGDRCDCKKDLI